MNRLLDNIDVIADAPGGIQKLREHILDLAVRGLLVPQDPADEPASELLKRIKAEKDKMMAEGKIKKQKPLPPIEPDEVPYELPEGWEWVCLESICHQITDGAHHTPNYVPKGIPFLSVKNLTNGKLDFSNTKYISEDEHKRLISRCHPEKWDVLLTKVGTTGIAKVIDIDRPFSIFVSVALLKLSKSLIDSQYIERLINSPLVRKYSEYGTEGVGNKNLVLRKIRLFVVPLPPLTEQKRIVARVDQLMPLCDLLEEKQQKRNSKRIHLNNSALDKLLNAENAETFQIHWQRIAQNFDTLYSVPENVSKLKSAILQLAVQGKLVEQDPNDEPASELLKKIKSEKDKLIAKGKIKKQKPLPPINPDEVPYELPQGWEWVRFINAGMLERGKSKHRPRNDQTLFTNGEYRLVQTGDISSAKDHNYIVHTFTSLYNEVGLAQSKMWPSGTLCITIAANIAETGFLKYDSCFPDSIVGFTSLIGDVVSKYVNFFLIVTKSHLIDYAPSTAQKNINLGILNNLLFPLPPLAEQKRIVAKVDQLMTLCDNIEKRLKQSEAVSERWAVAHLAS